MTVVDGRVNSILAAVLSASIIPIHGALAQKKTPSGHRTVQIDLSQSETAQQGWDVEIECVPHARKSPVVAGRAGGAVEGPSPSTFGSVRAGSYARRAMQATATNRDS
ncbi:MAG: hypothetical protein U1E25_14770 [Methylocystis sp.]